MKSESSWTKKQLAIRLSKLSDFEKVDVKLEQYATPSEIAADWVWNAALLEDIEGKVIADFAAGPGILGCAALLLGAKKVIFVDKSENALDIAKRNVDELEKEFEIGKSEFLCEDITKFNKEVDVVIQNPPFGTKNRHHDKLFLEQAFSVAKTIYSMHKSTTKKFVYAISKDYKYKITNILTYDFKLKQTLPWHKKRFHVVDVSVFRLEK